MRVTREPLVIDLTALLMAIGVFLLLYSKGSESSALASEPVFAGNSRELQTTAIVPTLDTPTQKKINTIWCGSFLATWKTMETDLAEKPLTLRGKPEVAHTLDNAPDPRPHIPAENLYVAAGWNQQGITERIAKDFALRFPSRSPPAFPGLLPNSFVAYAYLDANVKFSLPYFQNSKPLLFTDGTGKETALNSFGIRPEDDYAYDKLRQQPAILFEARNERYSLTECIVDLDHTSSPSQIILAWVAPKITLAETLKSVEEKIAAAARNQQRKVLGINDVLLVPDIAWSISHRFVEIEGREFTNSTLKGQQLDVAQQDIQFRLDRSGAELTSEAKVYMLPLPTYYVFDHPFLIYIEKRGAAMPYFVMWVENAELLGKWKSTNSSQPEGTAKNNRPIQSDID